MSGTDDISNQEEEFLNLEPDTEPVSREKSEPDYYEDDSDFFIFDLGVDY